MYVRAKQITVVLIAVIGAIGVAHFVFGPSYVSQAAQLAYEKSVVEITHSPERAYRYGIHYIRVSDAQDLQIARYFFEKTLSYDPRFHGAHYQLSRIDFLTNRQTSAYIHVRTEIALQGDSFPESYYMNGLIQGYRGNYIEAMKSFEHYLSINPDDARNWAAINDYSWALLKANQSRNAAIVLQQGLEKFPDNAWLINSYATVLVEIGNLPDAEAWAKRAIVQADRLTVEDVVRAYPGNGYDAAVQGLATFKNATRENLRKIHALQSKNELQ